MNLSLSIPLIAAVTSALGAFMGTWFSAKVSASTNRRVSHLQVATKIADFRQAWINDLRDTLAEFHSYGITPELDHFREREFYKLGSKIELLMNKRDPSFEALQDLLYRFLSASTVEEKFGCNAEFIAIGQEILKREWDTLKFDLRVETL